MLIGDLSFDRGCGLRVDGMTAEQGNNQQRRGYDEIKN